jgi:hypothetical protein
MYCIYEHEKYTFYLKLHVILVQHTKNRGYIGNQSVTSSV